jgi:hypothetical protein
MNSEHKDTARGERHVSLSDLFRNRSSFKGSIFDFGSAFPRSTAQKALSASNFLPPNWDNKVRIRDARTLVQSDGLPIVWVPRADIILSLVHASDLNERKNTLLECLEKIVEDCNAVLNDVNHQKLRDQALLARRAVDALASGHFEAAQALAVVVTETAVAKILGRSYRDVTRKVVFDPAQTTVGKLRLRLALAPIAPFYAGWYPSSGAPPPEGLSRHVSVHQADPSHYTRGNATVAVLLVSSVLRALEEFESEGRDRVATP